MTLCNCHRISLFHDHICFWHRWQNRLSNYLLWLFSSRYRRQRREYLEFNSMLADEITKEINREIVRTLLAKPPADYTDVILEHPRIPVVIAKRIWFAYRAGGDVECRICGRKYYDHPMETTETDWNDQPYLHVLCSGDRVKL